MRCKQMKIVNELPETKEEKNMERASEELVDGAKHDEIRSRRRNVLQDHKD